MECPICFEEITEKKNMKKTICGHKFCKECIEEWREKESSCPLCRENLEDKVVIDINENNYDNPGALKFMCSICVLVLSTLFLIFVLALIISIMTY
tara:strand:- start:95 stop:382 length:288 start_codon:yes stop_codon:yes gene_type:complete